MNAQTLSVGLQFLTRKLRQFRLLKVKCSNAMEHLVQYCGSWLRICSLPKLLSEWGAQLVVGPAGDKRMTGRAERYNGILQQMMRVQLLACQTLRVTPGSHQDVGGICQHPVQLTVMPGRSPPAVMAGVNFVDPDWNFILEG